MMCWWRIFPRVLCCCVRILMMVNTPAGLWWMRVLLGGRPLGQQKREHLCKVPASTLSQLIGTTLPSWELSPCMNRLSERIPRRFCLTAVVLHVGSASAAQAAGLASVYKMRHIRYCGRFPAACCRVFNKQATYTSLTETAAKKRTRPVSLTDMRTQPTGR